MDVTFNTRALHDLANLVNEPAVCSGSAHKTFLGMLVFDSLQCHALVSHHPHVAPLPSLSPEAGQTHAAAAPADIEAQVVDKVPILQGRSQA